MQLCWSGEACYHSRGQGRTIGSRLPYRLLHQLPIKFPASFLHHDLTPALHPYTPSWLQFCGREAYYQSLHYLLGSRPILDGLAGSWTVLEEAWAILGGLLGGLGGLLVDLGLSRAILEESWAIFGGPLGGLPGILAGLGGTLRLLSVSRCT